MNGLIPVEKDLFSVADRLKEIDERYRVFRNPMAHRFEVYVDQALQFVVPFPCLDARTLVHARKTRVERLDAIVKEMDKSNNLLEKKKEKELIDLALCQAGF